MTGQPWRDKKRMIQEVVHDTMGIYVTYYQVGGGEPVRTKVRLHNKFGLVGDDRSMGWAEMQDINPRAVFLLTDGISPKRGDILYVDEVEAYEIDNTLPPEYSRQAVEIKRLTPSQMEKRLPKEG